MGRPWNQTCSCEKGRTGRTKYKNCCGLPEYRKLHPDYRIKGEVNATQPVAEAAKTKETRNMKKVKDPNKPSLLKRGWAKVKNGAKRCWGWLRQAGCLIGIGAIKVWNAPVSLYNWVFKSKKKQEQAPAATTASTTAVSPDQVINPDGSVVNLG